MPVDTLIRDGTLVLPGGAQRGDLAISEGAIVAAGGSLTEKAREEIDAAGLHVFPGVMDVHVHFNEPGREQWEGFATGSAALAAGGGTSFFEMPLNADPPTLNGATFDAKAAAAKKNSRTDFALWGGLTPDSLPHLEELADRGVVGFKAFMSNSGIAEFGAADDDTLYRGMEIAAKLKLPVAVHAENDLLTTALAKRAIAEGRTTWADYLASRPVVAEMEAIRRAITFALDTHCSLHIVHISSGSGLRAAREMLNQHPGHTITLETCPHYLVMMAHNLEELGAAAKCAPPLRSAKERAHLLAELEAGHVDLIASDHSPAPANMKTGSNAFTIWGGIAGVQSTLPALLTLDVSPVQAAALTATTPAKRFRIPQKGQLSPGYDADLCLVDLNATYTLKKEDLLDRHKLSPYVGREFEARVVRTLCRGNTIFRDGKALPHQGRLLKPQRG